MGTGDREVGKNPRVDRGRVDVERCVALQFDGPEVRAPPSPIGTPRAERGALKLG